MQIIINADDLGYSKLVNDVIFSLIDVGCVTSSTIIANAPYFEEAAERVHGFAQASFGVHLNITEFQPLTEREKLKDILNSDGVFAGNIREVRLTSNLRTAIFWEWCAQIERARDCGVPISHLDSHHHVHTIPSLFVVLKRVQRKYGIRKVRRTRDVFDINEQLRPSLRHSKMAWNWALKHWYHTTTTERFTSFMTFHRRLGAGEQLLHSIELMCHPGDSTYEPETALLSTAWPQRVEERVRLISYNEL